MPSLTSLGRTQRSPQGVTATEQEWKTASGYFWIYYNTRKGRKPAHPTDEEELRANSPWVIMHFKEKEWAFSKEPDKATYHDIYAQEIRNDSFVGVQSVYRERHPGKLPVKLSWRRRRALPGHVRAFLLIEGTIKYR